MYAYSVSYDLLSESQLRKHIRQNILFEYQDTRRIRAIDPMMFDYLSGGVVNLNEGLWSGIKGIFSTGAELVGGLLDKYLKPLRTAIGGKVADLLGLLPNGIGAQSVVTFFGKLGIKDMFNILKGKGGCGKTLLLFTTGLINLIVRDIPKFLGMDPKGKITTILQKNFGEPVKALAKKLADGMCGLNWSEIVGKIKGMSLIAKFLPGGDKEGQKMDKGNMEDAFTQLPSSEKKSLGDAISSAGADN